MATMAAFILVAAGSCKRDDEPAPDPNVTRIIGSWKESFRAIDSNANGQPDSSERRASTQYRVATFYTNGAVRDTSFINGVASSIEASYTIDARQLTIIFPGIPPMRVLQLDENILTLRDSTRTPALITSFSKQ